MSLKSWSRLAVQNQLAEIQLKFPLLQLTEEITEIKKIKESFLTLNQKKVNMKLINKRQLMLVQTS
jgi:hypothetical protein